jgi:hypothetical protein
MVYFQDELQFVPGRISGEIFAVPVAFPVNSKATAEEKELLIILFPRYME